MLMIQDSFMCSVYLFAYVFIVEMKEYSCSFCYHTRIIRFGEIIVPTNTYQLSILYQAFLCTVIPKTNKAILALQGTCHLSGKAEN